MAFFGNAQDFVSGCSGRTEEQLSRLGKSPYDRAERSRTARPQARIRTMIKTPLKDGRLGSRQSHLQKFAFLLKKDCRSASRKIQVNNPIAEQQRELAFLVCGILGA
jgi:hypothetical protein